MFRRQHANSVVARSSLLNYDPQPYDSDLVTIQFLPASFASTPSTVRFDASPNQEINNNPAYSSPGFVGTYASLGRLNARITGQTSTVPKQDNTPSLSKGFYRYIINIALNGLPNNALKQFTSTITFSYSWLGVFRYLTDQRLISNRTGEILLTYDDRVLDNLPTQNVQLAYLIYPAGDNVPINIYIRMEISYRGSFSLELFYEFVPGLKIPPPIQSSREVLRWSKGKCPTILILSLQDFWFANDLGQAIFQSTGQKCLSRYFLDFTCYVVSLLGADGCTLASKALAIAKRDFEENQADQILGQIATYGLTKIYLWYLVTGQVMTTKILPRVYNRIFFKTLSDSPVYSCCAEIFQAPELAAVADYFVLLPPEKC